jgi:hypothetical protein
MEFLGGPGGGTYGEGIGHIPGLDCPNLLPRVIPRNLKSLPCTIPGGWNSANYDRKCTFSLSQLAGTWKLANIIPDLGYYKVDNNQYKNIQTRYMLNADGTGAAVGGTVAPFNSPTFSAKLERRCGFITLSFFAGDITCFVSDDVDVMFCYQGGFGFVRTSSS